MPYIEFSEKDKITKTSSHNWPVATMAIGVAGAKNAGLFAAAILAGKYPQIENALSAYRSEQTNLVLENADPREQAI